MLLATGMTHHSLSRKQEFEVAETFPTGIIRFSLITIHEGVNMSNLYKKYILVVIIMALVASCKSEELRFQKDDLVVFAETSTPTPTETSTQLDSMSDLETVTDADGNVYPTIQFGDQWWMAANLNVTSGPDEKAITGYCYDNDEENCKTYGRLYTWDEAMNSSWEESASGICPAGWHIPSDAEWQLLITYLGGGAVAGGKTKDSSAHYWASPNIGATNESNFNVLPTGFLDFTGEYKGLGEVCFYRTSSSQDRYKVYARELNSGNASIRKAGMHPDDALPVRCVKDSPP